MLFNVAGVGVRAVSVWLRSLVPDCHGTLRTLPACMRCPDRAANRNTCAGQVCVTYRGHAAGVDAVACSAVSPDVLASASLDGTVRLWDCRSASGSSSNTQGAGSSGFVSLGEQALSVAFHPSDGSRLVAGTVSGRVALLDARKLAAPLRLARLHRGAVFGVAFAAGGTTVPVGATSGSGVGTGADDDDAAAGAGAADAWAVASCSADKTAVVTNVRLSVSGGGGAETAVEFGMGAEGGHEDYVRKVLPLAAIANNDGGGGCGHSVGGGGFATCSWDRTVRLWGW